jgi:thymidylate synthase ThyX
MAMGALENKTINISRMECVKPDWIRVVNAARRTVGKTPINKEPSNAFKRKILLAEHSPIRLLEYDFTIENIRQYVTTHLVRHHEGCEKYVATQREDRNNEIKKITNKIIELLTSVGLNRNGWCNRDYLFQGEENNMDMTCNAQAFINISRKRLCNCASPETKKAWELVISMLKEIDPILAEKCVPECVYRNFCPESDRCCGYVNSKAFRERLNEYRRIDNNE